MKNMFVVLMLVSMPKIGATQDIGLSKQFSSCMDKADGVTIDMLECIDAETKLQDGRLNKAYKAAMTPLSAERKKQLQQAQRAWITYRDANCGFYADPEGGSIARIIASDCFMSATATRAKELEALSGTPLAQAPQTPPVAQSTSSAPSTAPPQPSAPTLTGPQKNAVRAAQSYLSISGFSRNGLIDQLSSPAGNKYTVEQARYGATQAGAC